MTGLALLLGFTAIVWLIVLEYRLAEEAEADFTDWADWEDNPDDWDFPEREAS